MDHIVTWSPGMSLDALEQMVIEKAYKFYRNNKTATANALGISIRTLDNKLEKYVAGLEEQAIVQQNRQRDRELQLARSRGLQPASAPVMEAGIHAAIERVVETRTVIANKRGK